MTEILKDQLILKPDTQTNPHKAYFDLFRIIE